MGEALLYALLAFGGCRLFLAHHRAWTRECADAVREGERELARLHECEQYWSEHVGQRCELTDSGLRAIATTRLEEHYASQGLPVPWGAALPPMPSDAARCDSLR